MMAMGRKISLALGIILLAATILLSAPEKIVDAVLGFRRDFIMPVLLLSCANYAARFFRWSMLLKASGIRIRLLDSIRIFFSAFLFSISPAKSGDLVKAYYLEKYHRTKYTVSLPVLVLERAYDVLGIVLLLSISSAAYFGEKYFFASALIAASVILAALFAEKLAGFFLEKIRPNFFGARLDSLRRALLSSRRIFSRKISVASLFLGTIAWFFECLGLYLVVYGFGISPNISRETFIYSASTLGGAASMLPGGLGVTEGGMATLLSGIASMPFAEAVSITLVIRAFTLWFAVLLGFIAAAQIKDTGRQKK